MTRHKNKSQESKPRKIKPKQDKPKQDKLWVGRYSASTDTFVEQFTQSVSYDQRLYHYDILG